MKSNYVQQLTWLRGFAAFLVIISHTLQATKVDYTGENSEQSFSFLSWLNLGSFGVVLFFALSGCTLFISNENKISLLKLKKFYLKRFFRIWPAFFISLIFYMVFREIFQLMYIKPQGYWVEQQFLSNYTFVDIFEYITFSFNFNGTVGLFNNAYWSLPVEFQYYLFFPVMVFLLNKFGGWGVFYFAVAIYLLPRLNVFPESSLSVFTLAYSFIGGVFIGWFYKRHPLFSINLKLGTFAILSCFVLVSLVENSALKLPDYIFISNKWNWFSILSLVTVFTTLFTPIKITYLSLVKFLSHYGLVSYSTYLYHNLILGILVLVIIEFGLKPSFILSLTVLIITFIVSYIVAFISYQYIEKPSIEVGRKF